MARECVTHHNACDCREEHFKALEGKLGEMTKFRDECERQFQAKVVEAGDLLSRLDSLQKEHAALIHDHERAMAREVNGMQQVAELEDQLAEALERDRKGDRIIHELTIERDRLAGRLDAIREIVEPTGAYLFSGHVNALAEIRAILVETCHISMHDGSGGTQRCRLPLGHKGRCEFVVERLCPNCGRSGDDCCLNER